MHEEDNNAANLDIRRFELCMVLCPATDTKDFWLSDAAPPKGKRILLWNVVVTAFSKTFMRSGGWNM